MHIILSREQIKDKLIRNPAQLPSGQNDSTDVKLKFKNKCIFQPVQSVPLQTVMGRHSNGQMFDEVLVCPKEV